MNLSFGFIYPDSSRLFFRYEDLKNDYAVNYTSQSLSIDDLIFQITTDDRGKQILSGSFSGLVVNRTLPYDTLLITDGRFDVTYGVTP